MGVTSISFSGCRRTPCFTNIEKLVRLVLAASEFRALYAIYRGVFFYVFLCFFFFPNDKTLRLSVLVLLIHVLKLAYLEIQGQDVRDLGLDLQSRFPDTKGWLLKDIPLRMLSENNNLVVSL